MLYSYLSLFLETDGCLRRLYKSKNNIEHLLCAGGHSVPLRALFFIASVLILRDMLVLWERHRASEIKQFPQKVAELVSEPMSF